MNWADSEKMLVPEKTGVATANFSIIHYLGLGEEGVLTGVPHGIGHVTLARGVFSHPGAHHPGRGWVVTAAPGVGWGLAPPQPPQIGSALGRSLGVREICLKKGKLGLNGDIVLVFLAAENPKYRAPCPHPTATLPPSRGLDSHVLRLHLAAVGGRPLPSWCTV
jgi:hypothetical protein